MTMIDDRPWCAQHHAEQDGTTRVVSHGSAPRYVHLGDERHEVFPLCTVALEVQELVRDGEVVERGANLDISGVNFAAGIDSRQLRALARAALDVADELDAAGGAR